MALKAFPAKLKCITDAFLFALIAQGDLKLAQTVCQMPQRAQQGQPGSVHCQELPQPFPGPCPWHRHCAQLQSLCHPPSTTPGPGMLPTLMVELERVCDKDRVTG